MAEETKTTAAAPATPAPEAPPAAKASEDVVVVPVAEKPVATEKEQASVPEPEPEAAEKTAAAAVEEEKPVDDEKVAGSASFKEETNVAGELPDPEKKALDELKQLVQEALNKHEFTAPPPPPAAKEEEKKAEEAEPVAAAASTEEAPKSEEKSETPAAAAADVPLVAAAEAPKAEVAAVAPAETKVEEKATPSAPAVETPAPVVVEKATTVVDDDGAKTVEAIEETIVAVSAPTPPAEEPAPTTEAPPADTKEPEAPASPPPPPEEVSIWGIPLLADERSDVILLKFLRARDFKVKEALTMLKNTVRWRKEFGIDSLLEEDFGTDLDKVVYLHGVDKEGHPVCYNAYGEFQNKELYQNTFSDEEKRLKFLRWRIQFLEKSIRKLDFSPDGICSFFQINDLKNSPGLFKRELRQATDQALQILQDNYPEFVAKQVFINVPWWYLAFYRMISPFFTFRTKSKFVFAGASKSAETILKYIAPEQVPEQYGGLSPRDGEQEFSAGDSVTEETIKAAGKHAIEFPVSEGSTFVWETRVVGWEVSYGAEFVPSAEGGYTVIIQKLRKIAAADETVVSGSFKISEPGKVVLTFDNQSSKKKKLLYRTKSKPSTSD